MDTLFQNLRYAARQMRRNPGFSVVVVVTIALGIGATTAIFSLANALLLRPLPVHEPDRLIGMVEVRESADDTYALSYARIMEYRDGAGAVVRFGGYGFAELAFQAGDEARVVAGGFVTGDYFELLGLVPAHGRFIVTDEEVPGVPVPVAVISHGLWQREFGGDPGVIGATVRLNSQPVTVVGVAPAAFNGVERGFALDLWVPIPMYAVLNPGSDIYHPDRQFWLVGMGRLVTGYDAPAAEAILGGIARVIEERGEPARGVVGVRVSPLTGVQPSFAGPMRLFFALLLAAAGLVLLIACVNVAGMLLAQGTGRRREVAVRLALGAGRRRLVGQLLTETTVLFLAGGAAGVLLASWLTRMLATLPRRLPGEFSMLSFDVAVDARVIAFGLLLACGTAILFGLAPALRATRPELVSALKEGLGATARRSRLRSAFVAGQIALCTLLLVSAGLLVRSLQGALAIDPGMDARGVVVAAVDIGPHGYDQARGRLFFQQLRDQLAARPEVEAVTLAGHVPLTFTEIVGGVAIPGHEPPAGRQTFLIDLNTVGSGYFEVLRIPVEGRGFTDTDGPDAARVAVVNRTMADRFWPGGNAVGQYVRMGNDEVEIVGVAADGKYHRLVEDPIPYMYLPFEQSYQSKMMVHVRAAGPVAPIPSLMQSELARLDSNVPLHAPASLERAVRVSLLPQRVAAMVIGSLGVLGLLLAAVGLYGVLAFVVGQRTREFGVRLALGAGAPHVFRLVFGQAGVLVLAGLGVGLVLAFAATRLLGTLLVNVSATDPATFVLVAMVLGAVALLAASGPARRATRVDPLITLKSD
jgi:putative ABC transport system permease protein